MHKETKKIKTTTATIKEMLQIFPEYRDNDERLVSRYWYNELKVLGKSVYQMTAFDFLKEYSTGLLTSADCIVRARANVQRQHPEIRGQTWKERHNIADQVTKEIYK